ncbi:ABC transporter ATP-binding protein [Lysinibacillus sp. LZ02]|uniref:ABC transporter ATP-binding protein n=1 Tax=Lysinibacillus sp. LZ02 TaxID=3420668 RepID=UPI003D36ABDB
MRLEINNITKKFKQRTAVKQFSMVVERNECVGVIGPNGAGKTTLIQMIADILEADEGNILLDGQKIAIKKNQIGYLPQYPNFFTWMTAYDTLHFMGTLSGIAKEQLHMDIPKILAKVGLTDEAQAKVGTFSGGMKQRLGIAQALLHKPALLIMDEPVSALDPIGRREVLNLLKDIKKDTTILLSTHILGDAEEICERFVMIKNGKKIEDATKTELLNQQRENVIYITIQSEDEQRLKRLEQLPYIQKIQYVQGRFKISIDDVEKNAHHFLQHVLKEHIRFQKFEIGGNESLEEKFLSLVVDV